MTATVPAMSEAELQEAILEYARLTGWLCFHTYDSRRSEPGYPDLHCLRGSRSIFVELKSERGTVSRAQGEWLAALQTAGHEVHIWRPAEWLGGLVEQVLRGSPA